MDFYGEEFSGIFGRPLENSAMNSETDDFAEFLTSGQQKRKRGRPTIQDNSLLGIRNHWKSFFEQCWPEVGWPLLCIRKRRSSTVEDVRKAFEIVRGKPHCDSAEVFLRGSPVQTTRKELLSNRIRSNNLHYGIQRLQSERPQLQLACTEVENALKDASTEDKERIQAELNRRREELRRLEERLSKAENEIIDLDKNVRDQHVFWYCSQLLAFLHCRRVARSASPRYALNPLNLANSLAGLDQMGWRQSHRRCSAMWEESFVQLSYRIFLTISRIWNRRAREFHETPVDFFRAELLRLSKKDGEGRDFLCEKWRDLRMAIEESWNPKHPSAFIPYAITSAFFRNLYRVKSSVDRVLEGQERLISP
ncbi:MAG TPA: hypothetical protein VGT03_04885 [Candidatus Acidoferrales bacterium]|nr:hypothetical protein [Candidatus Acidoferrales bacterium]